jgi:hypothetical protein
MQAGETDRTDTIPDSKIFPNPHNVARMIVINNSQIISAFLRSGAILAFISSTIALLSRHLPVGTIQNAVLVIWAAMLAVSIGFLIVGGVLDRALRRCPVCRTRITRETEKKRHCLECQIQLWDYWDEHS